MGEPDYLGMADALVVGVELALLAGDVDEAEILAASAVGVTDLPPPHLLNARAEIALAAVYRATGRESRGAGSAATAADDAGRLRGGAGGARPARRGAAPRPRRTTTAADRAS